MSNIFPKTIVSLAGDRVALMTVIGSNTLYVYNISTREPVATLVHDVYLKVAVFLTRTAFLLLYL